tara:strand:- start:597 stop:1256 length:660 start_codon:yes stop_codon:yes gene_type:complete
MHETVQKLIQIEKLVKSKVQDFNLVKNPTIIAVSKTFKIDKIMPLIDYGHIDYGENKVQEALDKWSDIKLKKPNLKLHLIGKLQSNKVKHALKIFDFIHSVDNEKLARKISEEQLKFNKKVKIFIQVNIGDENQKSGIQRKDLKNFYLYCQNLNLNVIGLMCLPPIESDSGVFFKDLKLLNDNLKLTDLSMGMSSDYINAVENFSTYLRIGSNIFGNRS